MEEISKPLLIWFGGLFLNGLNEAYKMKCYRLDMATDDVFRQREVRALHHKEQRRRHGDTYSKYFKQVEKEEEEEFVLELSPQLRALVIGPDYVYSWVGYTSRFPVAVGCTMYTTCNILENGEIESYMCSLDTRNLANGWDRVFMMAPRQDPLIVALKGEVYITGGTNSGEPWGEVFDTATGNLDKMTPCSSPEFVRCGNFNLVGAIPDASKLFYVSYAAKQVFYYNIADRSWEDGGDHPVLGFLVPSLSTLDRGQCAVVGATLYWFSHDFILYAYNLMTRNSYTSGSMRPHFDQLGYVHGQGALPPTLLHLSGDWFCLIWSKGCGFNDCDFTQVNCMKIKVDHIDETESLHVPLVSSHTYLIPGVVLEQHALVLIPTANEILMEELSVLWCRGSSDPSTQSGSDPSTNSG